jgi:tRNA pseudouridine38-40 synthase
MNTNYPSTIRRIDQIILEEHGHSRLIFSIKGNNFLYRMVRNVVGTLIHIGKAKIKKEEIPAILQSEKRANAGITAPAHALFLQSVFY